jgi:hypothetical protein
MKSVWTFSGDGLFRDRKLPRSAASARSGSVNFLSRPHVSLFICLLRGKRSVPSPGCHYRVVTDIALNVVNVPRFPQT